MGRALAIALIATLVATTPAFAGDCPDCPPPKLSDEAEQQVTPAQAVTATRAFLRAVKGKRPEVISATVAIPFLMELAGGEPHPEETAYCFDSARLVDEAEGLPGAPSCIATGLAAHATALERSLSKKSVFATLAALEKKRGAVAAPERARLEPLVNHRLVHVQARTRRGLIRVVIAVRLDTVEPRVDAVVAMLPK